MRPRQIKLDEIRTDGGTQPRAKLNDERIEAYGQDMKDGVKFPPVEVVCDGENFWLWDGFHRACAASDAGLQTIAALVTRGTKQDAQWLSYSANATHGLYRSNEDKRRAVTAAIEHPRSQALSDSAIAEHCGVSHTFVGKLRKELTCNGCKSNPVRTGKDGRTINTSSIGKPKTYHDDSPAGKRIVSKDEYEADGTAVDPDDIPLDMPNEAGQAGPKATTEATAADQLGHEITGEIAAAFARRGEITSLMSAVTNLKSTVLRVAASNDPLFAALNVSKFQADCGNLHRALRAIRPHAVCPYCAGDGCRACLDRGWVGQFVYDAAPKEMKQ